MEIKKEVEEKDVEWVMGSDATDASNENAYTSSHLRVVCYDYWALKEMFSQKYGILNQYDWNPKKLGDILNGLVKKGKLHIDGGFSRYGSDIIKIKRGVWAVGLEWPIPDQSWESEGNLFTNLVKNGKAKIVVDETEENLLLEVDRE
ncbi:MAG: hypothetical protein WAW67_05220 [Candidatus Omnitrophota bacterium]